MCARFASRLSNSLPLATAQNSSVVQAILLEAGGVVCLEFWCVMPGVFFVRSVADLDSLSRGPRLDQDIAVDLPDSEPGLAGRLTYRLNRDYNACGCDAATLALLASAAAGVGTWWALDAALVWLGAVIVLAGGVAGAAKTIAVWQAKRRMRTHIALLRSHITHHAVPDGGL